MNLNHFYHYYKSKSGGVSNLLLGSEELGSTGVGRWNQDLMNAVNANVSGVANPLNSDETVDQLDFQASKSAKIRQDVTLVAGTEYTFSVWARAASGTQPFRLRYYDNVGGSGGASAFTASATWSPTTGRYSFTFTAANSGTFTMMIQNAADAVSRRIYFWGAMLNVGATAADYIKTTFTGPSSPATPLMEFGDNFAGVTAYYSLRRFTIGEDTNAIRVRRSSDDTEQDIGFDLNGDLDSTALLAFVGTGGTDNGYVTKWYDQSGNGNDAINADASEQPLVVSGGALIEENSKAAIDFDGVDDKLGFASNLNIGGSPSIIGVLNTAAGDIAWRAGGNDYWYFQLSQIFRYRNGDFDATWINSDGLPNMTGSQKLLATYKNSTSVELAVDGTSIATKISGTGTDGAFNHIGSDLLNIDGVWQELIIYTSDQSTNRTGIEGNIDTYYSIT